MEKINPVIQDQIVKNTIEKQRILREQWMANHGVKYYKFPMEFENFYGSGKSTGTPGPKLTAQFSERYACDRSCPFTWLNDVSNDCKHPGYHAFYSNASKLNKEKDQIANMYDTLSKSEERQSAVCCTCCPESRYGICSNCFYKSFYLKYNSF